MMNINSENFDQWMFRYFEGELNPDDQSKLMSFIDKDPALKTDFEAWRDSYVIPETLDYPNETELLVGPANTRFFRWAALLLLFSALSFATWWFWPESNTLPLPNQLAQEKMQTASKSVENTTQAGDSDAGSSGSQHLASDIDNTHNFNSGNGNSDEKVIAESYEKKYVSSIAPDVIKSANDQKDSRSKANRDNSSNEVPKSKAVLNNDDFSDNGESNKPDTDRKKTASGDGQQAAMAGNVDDYDPEERDVDDYDINKGQAHINPEPIQIAVLGDPYMVRNTSSLFINPAFAGSERCGRISVNYLLLRPLGMGDFNQYIIGYDRYFPGLHGGVGIEMAYDIADQGAVNTSSARLIYSPKFEWRRVYSVEPALSISYSNQEIRWNRIKNLQDPVMPYLYSREAMSNDPARQGFLSVGAGVVVRHYKWIAGVALDNINRPLLPLTENVKMPVRYAAHASYRLYDANDSRLKLVPNMSYEYQAGTGLLTFGCSAEYMHWLVGMGVSNPDRLVSTLGYQSRRFEVGYSYEASFNNIMSTRPTAHELSFRYLLRCRGDKEDNRDLITKAY